MSGDDVFSSSSNRNSGPQLVPGIQEQPPCDDTYSTYSRKESLEEVVRMSFPVNQNAQEPNLSSMSSWERSLFNLDRMGQHMNLLVEDNDLFKQNLQRTNSDTHAYAQYIKIQRYHTFGLISYSVCTVIVLMELTFLLFIYLVDHSDGSNADKYKYLLVQEEAEYCIAWTQLLLGILGVVLRQRLARNLAAKSLWITVAVLLGWALWFISVFNLNAFRQFLVFLFCSIQICAIVVIVLTLH